MKIGLSFSRCVRDIVEGHVDPMDVLVIVARTNFNPNDDQQWSEIWRGYTTSTGWTAPEWRAYAPDDEKAEQLFRNVSRQLYADGKLHQPRQFDARPMRLPYYWLETVLLPQDIDTKPAVKEAWDRFQILAGLSSVAMREH